MISKCPQCSNQLSEFSVVCEKCGMNLVGQQSGQWGLGSDSSESPNHPPPQSDPEFENLVQQSLKLIENEDFAAALKLLNEAIDVAPSHRLPECYSLRGFVHLKSLDFERAEEDCSESISLEWEEAQVYVWRAAARGEQDKWRLAFDDLDRACELAGDQSDPYLTLMESYSETASEYFREQIQAGVETADLFFERGWVYLKAGQYKKAERDFRHALKLHPRHPEASVGMAELRLHDNKSDGVRELCDAGLTGRPSTQQRALRQRVRLNQRKGNIGLARTDVDQLARLADDKIRERVAVAHLRNSLGDQVAAIDELNLVLDEQPNHRIALLLRGDCFGEIRNYSLAIQNYSQYLRIYPDDVRALVRRAKVFMATHRFELAHRDLDRAVEVDETHSEIYLIRSKIYLEDGKLDQALTECRKSVRLDNQNADAFCVMANVYTQMCDYGNAIQEYARSIELASNPEEKGQCHYLCGVAYYEACEFDKAIREFRRSCRLRPNHAGAWIWKAATCARLDKWKQAILGLQQAIQVRPSAAEQYQQLGKPVAEKAISYFRRRQQKGVNTAKLFRSRGLAYQFIGHDPEAVVDYTAALNREPDDIDTQIRRGQVYTRMGDHDSAVKDFTKILRADKYNHHARFCRAIAWLAKGNPEKATSDLRKAIKVDPEQPSYHVLLGEILQEAGDHREVIEALERAILLDPTNPVSYRRRGLAHLALGHYLEAINDFTRSLELSPAQFDLLMKRGQCYLKTDQSKMAIEDFELALTHNDQLVKCYTGRACVLAMQQRHSYALIWLTKAIHRFKDPRELAEILFARGKIYYEMGRAAPAMTDFSSVMKLVRQDRATLVAARYARAIAAIHADRTDVAKRDFTRLAKMFPANQRFQAGVDWLADQSRPLPEYFSMHVAKDRPTRPPIVRNGVELSEATLQRRQTQAIYDSWIVRTEEKKEYGPVHLAILKSWAAEGRLNMGMKVLRSDWSKWQRVEKIFVEITPLESNAAMEAFPELETNIDSHRSA